MGCRGGVQRWSRLFSDLARHPIVECLHGDQTPFTHLKGGNLASLQQVENLCSAQTDQAASLFNAQYQLVQNSSSWRLYRTDGSGVLYAATSQGTRDPSRPEATDGGRGR